MSSMESGIGSFSLGLGERMVEGTGGVKFRRGEGKALAPDWRNRIVTGSRTGHRENG